MTESKTTNGRPEAPARRSERRFEPSSEVQPGPVLTEVGEERKRATHGRRTLGRLVAIRRNELGLTRADLAARMGVSLATVARIEEGHPPSTDALRSLATALPPEEGKDELSRWIERELHWRSPQYRRQGARGAPGALDVRWRSLDGRWRWRGPAAVVLAAVLLTAAVFAAARSFDNGSDSSAQPVEVASAPPPAPPPPVEAPAQPQKAKKAQKSKAAEAKPAPVTDSDESSSSSSTSSDSESSSDAGSEPPVRAPVVTPSPTPSSSQSSGPRPGIKHGIQGGF